MYLLLLDVVTIEFIIHQASLIPIPFDSVPSLACWIAMSVEYVYLANHSRSVRTLGRPHRCDPTGPAAHITPGRWPLTSWSSFILRITHPQSSVTPPLAGPSGRRPPGMWRSPEPSPGSGGPPGLRATHAAWRRWWQPQKARLDHPGDVHFGLLKPISFIPWLWNESSLTERALS